MTQVVSLYIWYWIQCTVPESEFRKFKIYNTHRNFQLNIRKKGGKLCKHPFRGSQSQQFLMKLDHNTMRIIYQTTYVLYILKFK